MYACPGVITKDELGAVMHSLGLKATSSQLEDMINEIDLDHTGTVDLEGRFSLACYMPVPSQTLIRGRRR